MLRLPTLGLQSQSNTASVKFFLYFICCHLSLCPSELAGCLPGGWEGGWRRHDLSLSGSRPTPSHLNIYWCTGGHCFLLSFLFSVSLQLQFIFSYLAPGTAWACAHTLHWSLSRWWEHFRISSLTLTEYWARVFCLHIWNGASSLNALMDFLLLTLAHVS